jgi:hypothetical protein
LGLLFPIFLHELILGIILSQQWIHITVYRLHTLRARVKGRICITLRKKRFVIELVNICS